MQWNSSITNSPVSIQKIMINYEDDVTSRANISTSIGKYDNCLENNMKLNVLLLFPHVKISSIVNK